MPRILINYFKDKEEIILQNDECRGAGAALEGAYNVLKEAMESKEYTDPTLDHECGGI